VRQSVNDRARQLSQVLPSGVGSKTTRTDLIRSLLMVNHPQEKSLINWIAKGPGGEGFVEVADAVLAGRTVEH
jgi:hypothetical protein